MVELIIVVAIIAILSGIGLVRYAGSLTNYRADAAARKIAADLSFAQTRARVTSSARTFTINPLNNSYSIADETQTYGSLAAFRVALNAEPYFARLGTLTIGAPADRSVVFDAYGIPTGAGSISILVGTTSRTITIDATSGRAIVSSP